MVKRAFIIGILLIGIAIPTASHAQLFDHMTCYKVRDSVKFKATVALDALQDQFDLPGECTVKGKAALFCVPTEKTVTSFEIDKAPGTPDPARWPCA